MGPATPKPRRGGGGLRVAVTDARGRPAKAPGLAAWLRRAAPARVRGDVSVALVSDARIRAFNRAYRGKDYATDVLSFPAAARLKPHAPGKARARTRGILVEREALAERPLGDIVIAKGIAGRQARERGHSTAVELRIL